MTDLHVDANISATGNITTTNSNLQAPQGSIYVQANVVAAGQMFADGNIYGNAALFVTSANISGALAVDSIATDVYTYANGAPVPLNGTGYGNSNVAEFLPTYTGAISSSSLSINNDVIALGQGAGASGAAGIVAIGNLAGTGNGLFSTDFVAIGNLAGSTGTGNYSVSVGANAGSDYAGANAVLIGRNAGATHGVQPGINMVAIGAFAGSENQGNNAVAIGYLAGANNQAQNSIVINATGNVLQGGFAGTYIAPIRENAGDVPNGLYYNVTTKEVTYGATGNAAASYGNANVELLLSNGTLGVSIIPGNDNLYTLGDDNDRWANIYTGSSVVIKGEDLTVDAGGVLTYNGLPVIIGDANGNITAPYFFGDGSGLTGGYGNANVEIYLPDYAGDLPSVGNVVAAGNVTANYFIGNGSQLTGMYGDANVETYLPTYTGNLGNVTSITATANISATNLTVTGESNLGAVTGVTITGGNVGEVLTTNGSGDLTWQAVDLNIVPPVYLTAPIAGNNQVFSNTILASYNSNVEMTVFYNGSLLENTNYTLSGDEITVNIPLAVGDGIDVVTTIASSVNSIVSSGYGNSNVAAYLPSYTGSLPSLTGNVRTVANVQAAYFIGNGSQLTGLPASYANSNVATYLASNANVTITTTGNITAPTVTAGNIQSIAAGGFNSAITDIELGSTVIVIISSLVFGGPQTGQVTISGVVGTTEANGTWYFEATDTERFQLFTDNTFTTPVDGTTWTTYVSGGTAVSAGNYTNLTVQGGNVFIKSTGNITIDPLGDGLPNGNVVIAGNLQVTGNITYNDIVNATTNDLQWIAANNAASPALATGAGLAVGPSGSYATFTFNAGANSWQSSLPVTVTGNVTANYFIGNGSQLTGLPAGYANSDVANYLSSGTDTAGYVTLGDIEANNILAVNSLTTNGDLSVLGNAAVSGNLDASYFIGNGSQLTGLPAGYSNSDVSTYLASGDNTDGYVTLGNISVGGTGLQTTSNDYSFTPTTVTLTFFPETTPAPYNTNDRITVSGVEGADPVGLNGTWTVISGTTTTVTFASTLNAGTDGFTNIPLPTITKLNTSGITATGNITGAFIIGDGSQLTGLPPGYANSDVADYLASNANVVITTTGNITSTANISGDYIIGNGSQLTGMYGNTEVDAYLPTYTGNLGNVNSITASGNITVTGNLTASNIGNVAGANYSGVGTQWLSGNGTWQTPPGFDIRNITKVDQAYGYGTAFIIADGRLFIAKGNGTNNAFCSALNNQSVALQAGINNMYELPFVEETVGTIVDAGQYGPSAYALFSNGNLYTWGYNGYGQLGIGSTTDRFLPVLSNSNVAQVYVTKAQNSTYGIQRIVIRKNDNTYFGCGHDGQYQFGLGTNPNARTSWTALPWIPATALSVWMLGGDLGNIFVQEADGQIRVTGYNGYGQLGINSITQPTGPQPAPLWLGGDTTMRIQNICWGGSYQNEGGTSTYTNITMLLDNGTTSRLVGAGSNNWGTLGRGNLTDSRVPVAPSTATGLTGRITKIASCGNSPRTMYALLSTGVLYSWGYNEYGAVGNGSTTNVQSPYALSVNVLDILGDIQGWDYIGYYSPSPFVKKADGYYSCGYNEYGNLGDGSVTNKNVLTKLRLPKDTSIKFFATYGNNQGLTRLGITEQNTIYAWGYNSQGQIDPLNTSWQAVQPLQFMPSAMFPGGGGAVDSETVPAFSAVSNTTTSVTGGSAVIVSYNVEEYDSDNWFASNRFTPQRAGWYQFNAGAYLPTSSGSPTLQLRKNSGRSTQAGGSGVASISTSKLIYMNGSTDYVEVYIGLTGVTGTFSVTQETQACFFNGFWVRS